MPEHRYTRLYRISEAEWPKTLVVGGHTFHSPGEPRYLEGFWYQERDENDEPIGEPEWIPPSWNLQYVLPTCPYHSEHGLYTNITWTVDQDLQPKPQAVLDFRSAKLMVTTLSLEHILRVHSDLNQSPDSSPTA